MQNPQKQELDQKEFCEEVVSCAKCTKSPEEILILTCDHNLCLYCAARNLMREEGKG
jgi:hypothetical protein